MSKKAANVAAGTLSKEGPRETLGNAMTTSNRAFRKLKTVNRALRNFSYEIGDEKLPAPQDEELHSICEQLRRYEERLESALDEAWKSFIALHE